MALVDYAMVGPAISLGLSGVGSCIGCSIAGTVSHAVMARVDEGHGKYIALSAAPSSQMVYGFLLMLLMANAIKAGTLTPINAIAIGTFSGAAFVASSVFQGMVAASAIQAAAKKPAVFGKCFAAVGIIESFALFAFVFALLLF